MAGTGIRRTLAAWPMALTRMLSITTGLSLHIGGWVIVACINDHLMAIKCRDSNEPNGKAIFPLVFIFKGSCIVT